MGLDDILSKYRSDQYSKSDLGTKFEELIKRYLVTDPEYSPKIEKVWSWRELGGHDIGIDIVVKTKYDEYWAVQCKCYAEEYSVTKPDVDTFISTSYKKFKDESGNLRSFDRMILFATTENWSENALAATEGQTIPFTRVRLSQLEDAAVDWDEIEEGVHGKEARRKKYALRPHQEDALNKALEHYKTNDRGQMIMACGTGKTFTSLKIAETLTKGKGSVLFLAPSISLVGQSLKEWTANAKDDLNTICVCSDPKVSKKFSDDGIGEHVEDLGYPATTDPEKILNQFKIGNGLKVIFSTYQSIDSIIEAQKNGIPEFDLIVCDEAHRTTGAIIDGRDESAFTKVHNNENIKGKRRLYMTATPRLYGEKGKKDAMKASAVLCSMDNENTYGKVFYKITFGEAVDLELLTDYKVLVFTARMSDVPDIIKRQWEYSKGTGEGLDIDLECKIWGSMNALAKNIAGDETVRNSDPGKMRSAVAFSRTIPLSKVTTDRFNEMTKIPLSPINVEVQHIDGTMDSMKRDKKLGWLKKDDGDKCRILSNVRCLSEGVDVPALDAVIFMNSKGSLIDIVQSVGRVMRKADGKKCGYIIVPIIVPEDEDPEEALNDDERYKLVWDVLRALRSHDARLDAEINTFLYRDNAGGGERKDDPRIVVGGSDGGSDTGPRIGGRYTLDDFGMALMARLVLKVGDREYIENWARDVAKIMPELMEQLTTICKHDEQGYKKYGPVFKRYFKGLKDCINEDVTEEDAVKMLAQQIITKPIFTALFGDDKFVRQNSVSQTIDAMLNEIDARNGLKGIDLSEFYEGVERTLTKVETLEGKQKVITSLYEKFFKNAFPKDQTINGIVYTPLEIVDFILHSAAEVLKQEFDIDISSENVNILDPFTGTGTFIARLIESGIISPQDLERKYRKELFANEITLLAYYIAAVNIENAFTRMAKNEEYIPFEHILLTDTFNIEEICKGRQATLAEDEYFKKNISRIKEECKTPITVIIGNPPYGGRQKSSSDDAKKRTYDNGVDSVIETEYLTEKVNNVNAVYDNYIRAFRWSTDRIQDNDGIIAFVTPNGWLSSSAFVGFRKCIEKEFSKIYVFNLRGDQNGTNWREEGEKIFGQGSKVGISITLFVKRKNFKDKAKVLYVKTNDYMKRQEKLNLLSESGSFSQMEKNNLLERLNIKENGDWIIQRNDLFDKLIPIAGDTLKKFDRHSEKTIFVGYSSGYKTNRDIWTYNFSRERVAYNMRNTIEEYNIQTECGEVIRDPSKIAWTDTLEARSKRREKLTFDEQNIQKSNYRLFNKRWFYSDEVMIERSYQNPKLFPNCSTGNMLICVSGIGVKSEFSCIITDRATDLGIVGVSQCFPLYWYEDSGEKRSRMKVASIDGTNSTLKRHDSISDYALKLAREKYRKDVTKEDIFYYVYGYLHSPDYRDAFLEDLKLSLPKIDFVNGAEDFLAFSKAGRDLAELHLNYETQKPLETLMSKGAANIEDILSQPDMCRIDKKMKVLPKEGKVIYNQYLTIENIPAEAFDYVVNGRSAIEWIADQYQYSVDKASGIVNDPNEYAGGKYVIDLLLSVITVSARSVDIIKSLPTIEF